MRKILIVKLGALGDVLRTTVILHKLKKDEIYWVTHKVALPLLKDNPYIKKIIAFDNQKELKKLKAIEFDLVLSLDDEIEACQLVTDMNKKEITGAYYAKQRDKPEYTLNSAGWFDIGLISSYGISKANKFKKQNKRSFQEYLFEMINERFSGERYIMDVKPKNIEEGIIGIEARCGARWHTKRWDKYPQLVEELKRKSYKVKIFKKRKYLRDYIEDISNCKVIVTGDTLAMHAALGLEKRTVALFGPTSAAEIYDYGLLKKIITPLNCYSCYKRECEREPNCMEAISLNEVVDKVVEVL